MVLTGGIMSILSQLSKIAALNWAFGSLSILLNFPPLIGYIVTGFIVGPWASKYISNAHSLHTLHEIGDIGLLLLMFFTGMEINIVDFLDRKKAGASITVVCCQFILTIFITLCAYIVIHITLIQHCYDFNIINSCHIAIMSIMNNKNRLQIISLVTALIFLNSTAIPIQLLESKNKKSTVLGQTIVSILVMQDIFLIPVIIGLKSFTGTTDIYSVFFKIFLAFAAMYLVRILINVKAKIKTLASLYDIEWMLDEISNFASINKAIMPISLIFFALACARISEIAGLSDIYGAFIAGMIIGNLTSDHKLLNLFNPIIDLMSIPFFMNIGVMLNLGNLQQHWQLISICAVSVLLIKFIYNYTILFFMRHKNQFDIMQRLQAALLLSQVSEFSFFLIMMIAQNLPKSEHINISIIESTIMLCLTLGSVLIVVIKQVISRYSDVQNTQIDDDKDDIQDEH